MDKQRILSVAALDSSGGAGLNQDIKVSTLFNEDILTCATGTTLQTKYGVEAIHPIPDEILAAHLQRITQEYEICYIKIGALCSISQVSILLEHFTDKKSYKIVLDPVMKPTHGMPFIKPDELSIYAKLLKIANFITPNIIELSLLSGLKADDFDSAMLAAKKLAKLADIAVLVKSGHTKSIDICEAFVSQDKMYHFHRTRHNWDYSHGTGCALSMAFTCLINKGMEPCLAFEKASQWVADLYDKIN